MKGEKGKVAPYAFWVALSVLCTDSFNSGTDFSDDVSVRARLIALQKTMKQFFFLWPQ